eukprot:9463714-Alexandrium_andersonii.AAC.1
MLAPGVGDRVTVQGDARPSALRYACWPPMRYACIQPCPCAYTSTHVRASIPSAWVANIHFEPPCLTHAPMCHAHSIQH